MLLKSALSLLAFVHATDVRYKVTVEYQILGENDNSKAIHRYQKSERFDHAYDNLGMSLEASFEGWGASGNVAFAMSQMSDDTSSSKSIESLSQNSTTTFQDDRFQVWRVISKEMTIDGDAMESTDRVYIYDQPKDKKYDREYWNKQAIEYLNLNLLPDGVSTTRNNYEIRERVQEKPKDNTDIHLLHSISVDFPVTGYSYTYWWQETYTYSESYVKTVRELSTSASVSGSYGDVSASASFAFDTAKSRTSHTSGETKKMNANYRNYPDGQYQIWRRVKETVTVNGKSSVVERIDPYDVAFSYSEIQSPEYYRQLANDYLKNTILPADIDKDDRVHKRGATVYTKHSVIKGQDLKDFYDVNRHIELHGRDGEFLSCPAGYVATGVCGSGSGGVCRSPGGKWHGGRHTGWYNSLRCTKLSNTSSCGSWQGHNSGTNKWCTGGQVVTGFCGSGRNRNCRVHYQGYHSAQKCCDAESLDLDFNDQKRLYLPSGEFGKCPNGYVLFMTCGSGSRGVCTHGTHNGAACVRARPKFSALG